MTPETPHTLTRRDALKTLGAGAALLSVGAMSLKSFAAERPRATAAAGASSTTQPFELPKLGYAYDALEPHIDARTMEIHHTKHHQSYINNANKALAGQAAASALTAEALLSDLLAVPEGIRTTVRNNVGGHVNHAFFWKVIGPKAGGAPRGELAEAIRSTFGSFDAFKTEFGDAAAKRFGSGWAWLVVREGKLAVQSTANQDSPLSEGAVPVLGLDVWEHAYYLNYQNRRGDYVKAFWNVVNWDQAAANYRATRTG